MCHSVPVNVSNTHSPFEATGAFPGEAAARQAVARLRAEGMAQDNIEVCRDGGVASPPSDMPAMSRVFWSGLIWSIVGGAIGAGAGLVVGLLDLGVPGTPTTIAIQITAWAMFGHVLGALLGCYLALDTGDRFANKASHHDPAATLVRVRVSSAEAASRAEEIMQSAGALLKNGGPDSGAGVA
jgi:hypothetical protein